MEEDQNTYWHCEVQLHTATRVVIVFDLSIHCFHLEKGSSDILPRIGTEKQ